MALKFEEAWDVKQKVGKIVRALGLSHIDLENLTCFRSKGSKTRAYARIWEFPKIWQLALNRPPHYIIELINPKFDRLSSGEQEKVLIHELLHIPKNFSGALRSHGKKVSRYLDHRIDYLHGKFKEQ